MAKDNRMTRALGFSRRADGRVRHTAVVNPATGRDRAVTAAVKHARGKRANYERRG
jgi:hypothetical protein